MFKLNYILMSEAGAGDAGTGGAAGAGDGGQGQGDAGQGQGNGDQGQGNDQPTPWAYAEGVNGEGDRPDWFKEKYTTIEAQAKAYNDLESRFGSFTGSPDEYATPEGYVMEGESAIMAKTIEEIAKNSNMDQNTYNLLIEGVSKNIEGYRESIEQESIDAAVKSIPNFENRRSALADTMQTNLTTNQFEAVNKLMTSVESFEAMEAIANTLRGGALPGSQAAPQQRSIGDIMSEMNKLTPTDMRGRNKLIEELNKAGGGKGTLV